MNNNNQTTGQNIRKVLPYGAIKRVADKTKTPYSTVNAVIDGRIFNDVILKALKQEIDLHKKKITKSAEIRSRLFVEA